MDLAILADVLSSSSYAPAMTSYLPHVIHLFIASSFRHSFCLVHIPPLIMWPLVSHSPILRKDSRPGVSQGHKLLVFILTPPLLPQFLYPTLARTAALPHFPHCFLFITFPRSVNDPCDDPPLHAATQYIPSPTTIWHSHS